MMGVLLQVSGLTRAFGGLIAVNDLSFSIAQGEIAGLLGPNGSGKTTALNLISGLLAADRGSILFAGTQLAGLPAHRIARIGVARTFQLVRVLGTMTCRENVEAGLAFHPGGAFGWAAHARAAALLERVGLDGKGQIPAGDLTYIDQKRLELARALALAPRLLLLDEWLAGLNPTELLDGIALIRSLRDEGLTVLLVEHVMDAVHSLCDRCIVMNAGLKIADGPTRAVLTQPEVVGAYLGEEVGAAEEGAPHA
jgi:branched-chain amino acid transport system ATP-binding protein